MMLWVIVYPSLVNGVEAKHQFNARNQLIKSFEGDTITDNIYDGRGNLTQVLENGQQKTNYTFDAANQLVSVANRLGSASYGYDGFRNRVKKLENMTDVRYVNDMTLPYNNLLDMNGQRFVWGNSLLSAKGEKDFYYLQDHLGSPIRLLGENQDDVLDFDEFGVPMMEPVGNQPFGFTGYQMETGGLQYAQARYYDPAVGRFSAEDPIKDQLNWYGYCGGNPVNFIDPSGLREDGPYGTPGNIRPQPLAPQPDPSPRPFVPSPAVTQILTEAENRDAGNSQQSYIQTLPSVSPPPAINVTISDAADRISIASGAIIGGVEVLGGNYVRRINDVPFLPLGRWESKPFEQLGRRAGTAGIVASAGLTGFEVIDIWSDNNLTTRQQTLDTTVVVAGFLANVGVGYLGGKIGGYIATTGVFAGLGKASVPTGILAGGVFAGAGGVAVDWATGLARDAIRGGSCE